MSDSRLDLGTIIEKTGALVSGGDLDSVIAFIRGNESVLQGQVGFYMTIGDVLIKNGRVDAGSDFLLIAYRMLPENVDLGKTISDSLWQAGCQEQALEILGRLWGADPENQDIANSLANKCREQGDVAGFNQVTGLMQVLANPIDAERLMTVAPVTGKRIRRVVLVAPYPRARSWKIARAIRNFGAEVIYVHPANYAPKPNDPFDETYVYGSLLDFRRVIDKVVQDHAPDLFHVFCDGYGYPEAVSLMNMVSLPVVWDYYDLTNVSYVYEKAPQYHLSMKLERWCIAQADGICARNMELQVAKRRGFKRKNLNTVFFPDYCYEDVDTLPKLGDADGNLHIFVDDNLSVTGANGRSDILPKFIERMAGVDDIQMYFISTWRAVDERETVIIRLLELAEKHDNIHFINRVTEREHLSRISRYDVVLAGVMKYDPGQIVSCNVTLDNWRHYYANRVADCIDAGVMFCSPSLGGMGELSPWLIRRLNIALFPKLEEFMDADYWRTIRDGMRARPIDLSQACRDWSVSGNSDRLGTFYQKVLLSESGV